VLVLPQHLLLLLLCCLGLYSVSQVQSITQYTLMAMWGLLRLLTICSQHRVMRLTLGT
jgi:hypothetical protein